MKSFSKSILLACLSLAVAQTSCPPEPQGILQAGKPAIVTRTLVCHNPIVYTEQIEHEFEEDEDMLAICETAHPAAPKIFHHGCINCKTYRVMNICGYTLASKADIAELEALETAAAETEEV